MLAVTHLEDRLRRLRILALVHGSLLLVRQPRCVSIHQTKEFRMRHTRVVGLLTVMVVCVPVLVFAQDRKSVDPSMKILLENDRVRVQEHFLKPGEKIALHEHPEKVIYAINDWKVRETLADGTIRVVEGKAGTARWGKATTHAVENIGATEVRNIVIELKK